MLVPRLSILQKVDNLETRVNMLNKFETLFTNEGPHILQKRPGEVVIYLKNVDILNLSLSLLCVVGAYKIYT